MNKRLTNNYTKGSIKGFDDKLITSSIYTDRLKRLKSLMEKTQIQSLIVPLSINFRYLFGLMEEPSERPFLGLIQAEGSPILLVPDFEVERAKKITGVADCRGWGETQDPYVLLSDLLLSNQGKKIGIEPKMWFSVFQKVKKNIQANFVSTESLFDSMRMIKDEEEQKILLKASQKSADVIVDSLKELRIGITEGEMQSILMEKLKWGTNEKTFALVQFGENSALPHYHGGERKLQNDDIVLIDAGGSLYNYWGDITITTVFGKATRRFKKIYDVVFSANKQAKDAVVQNKLPSEIDKVARDHIAKNEYEKYFTHRTGHGLGLEVHEPPYIVGNNHHPLVSGNVFTIEPGIYLPGKFGVRIEDDVIKTETGIKTSQIPRYELIEI